MTAQSNREEVAENQEAMRRWAVCMAEAGFPVETWFVGADGVITADPSPTVTEEKIRAAWKAHQIARTPQAERFPDCDEYVAWWRERNPTAVFADA